MKRINLKQTVGGALLGLSLLLGIGMMSATTAQAQYRNDDYYRRNRDYNQQRRRDTRYDRYRGNNSNDNYPNYGGSFEARQTALNAGYNEGLKEGRKDRNRGGNNGYGYGYGSNYGYSNSSAYQRATKDYSSRFGNPALYQQYFRLAFQTGYRDGLNGN
ncbi:MAG: hypothetical protein QOJ88_1809 [Pyrinomonadaceae bacterium]|nr:hypothetical protein [Pyrinomonadaceae bacterium]